MDSEDERAMEKEEAMERTANYRLPLRSWMSPKLYGEEERDAQESTYQFHIFAEEYAVYKPKIAAEVYTAYWRHKRFLDALEGFHTGSLDLAGRSEARYKGLRRRIDDYIIALSALREHANKVPASADSMNNHLTDRDTMEWVIEPSSLLDAFLAKWKLSDVPLDHIFSGYMQITLTLKKHPTPKFQKLFLLDLHPELIYIIMDFSDVDEARALGAACRSLRQISLSYIYKSRHLCLGLSPNWQDDYHRESIWAEMINARDVFLAGVAFLCSRADIIGALQKLRVESQWDAETRPSACVWKYMNQNKPSQFFLPMWSAVDGVLVRATGLTELIFTDVLLNRMTVRAMAAMPALHSVSVIKCWTTPMELGTWVDAPRLLSVCNITIIVGPSFSPDNLALLELVPNARMLDLRGHLLCPVLLPLQDARTRYNPFRAAERVILSNLVDEEVPALIAWMAAASELHLTHFELDALGALRPAAMTPLLDILARAPLETLALVGLTQPDAAFFAHLALAAPGVRALTLVLRGMQHAAAWPELTGTYAAWLAPFARLAHFGWNFRTSATEGAPEELSAVERGVHPNADADPLALDALDEGFFVEWSCLARLFTAHCAALRCLMFLKRGHAQLAFGMARDARGKLLVEQYSQGLADDRYKTQVMMEDACPQSSPLKNPWILSHWRIE